METTQTISIMDEVVGFLASTPTPEQILAFHPSEMAQERLHYLLDQNRNGVLTAEENVELEEMSRLNHSGLSLEGGSQGVKTPC
jgi:hypothetical protein